MVAHSDIAPSRKIDPGELFPWDRLAAKGIGFWPTSSTEPVAEADAGQMLQAIGYDIAENDFATVLSAFQRRFRPACFDGVLDRETRARIAAVHELVAETFPSA